MSAVVIQLLEDRLTEGEQRIVSIEKSHWKGLARLRQDTGNSHAKAAEERRKEDTSWKVDFLATMGALTLLLHVANMSTYPRCGRVYQLQRSTLFYLTLLVPLHISHDAGVLRISSLKYFGIAASRIVEVWSVDQRVLPKLARDFFNIDRLKFGTLGLNRSSKPLDEGGFADARHPPHSYQDGVCTAPFFA